MRSIIALRSNITRRQANITEAHFLTECASTESFFLRLQILQVCHGDVVFQIVPGQIVVNLTVGF